MKHVRNLEPVNSLDDLLAKRDAEKHHLSEDHQAGPNFFRGVIIALPVSMSLWALVLYAFT